MSAQKGLKGSLTALGTAAVLGIYSAGYALTEEAAQRLEEPLGALSTPPLPPDVAVQVLTEAPSVDSVVPEASSPEVAAATEVRRDEAVASATTAQTAPIPTASTPTPTETSATPAPSTTGTANSTASAPVPASPPATAGTGTTATSTADSAGGDAPEASPYRDGTYTSRGMRTRHGTIDATVEISGGRIVSATVSSCGMRWPCSDIDRIIPRVVQRQSTAIGIVSGATQSSEAFITAVDAALLQAMNPTP